MEVLYYDKILTYRVYCTAVAYLMSMLGGRLAFNVNTAVAVCRPRQIKLYD